MKNFILIFLLLNFILNVSAETITGIVTEKGSTHSGRIIDKKTGNGIGNAKITLPKEGYRTNTDKNGYFELDTSINGTSILSVQKDKYKPFSMTINQNTFSAPLEVSIEKSDVHDMLLDSNMYHLGDGSFSDNSANAGEFRLSTIGPFYTKKFNLKNINTNLPVYLVIGSIIGIDTYMARSMGQNKMPNAYASPPEVYFNGNKVAEIKINGDGQKIKLPSNLVKKGKNEIVIKTGRNLMQTAYIDYDDIEFMNLIIEN